MTTYISSSDLQQRVYDWACEHANTAPYGVIMDQGKSQSGRPYLAVTFGRARTLDAHVQIYSSGWIIVKTNRLGDRVCRSPEELQQLLDSL